MFFDGICGLLSGYRMAGRTTKRLVALSGIRKNGNRTWVQFPNVAPTGVESINPIKDMAEHF